jgi:hypothetical protein
MSSRNLLPMIGCIALGAVLAACASPTGDEASTSSEAAYTVPNGQRFVVSATKDRVVLEKTAGGSAFPFAPEEMVNKAILIHPVKGKAADGVYAWVRSVSEQGERYVLAVEPLRFDEMEEVKEDDIIRIYLDRSLARPGEETGLTTMTMGLGVQPGLAPRALGGLFTGELPVEGEIGNIAVAARVHIWQKEGSLTADPRVRVGWQRGKGLELGFRMNYAWESTLAFDAELKAGMVFETPSVRTPRIVVAVPIGPVPVPVTLGLAGNFECKAVAGAKITGAVKIAMNASFGGSSFIRPSSKSPPSRWVTQGAWPYTASGSASVKPEGTFEVQPGGEIECLVPRIALETLVAGVAGPFVALGPTVGLSAEGLEIGAELTAGFEAELFGREAKGEVVLLSWKPN